MTTIEVRVAETTDMPAIAALRWQQDGRDADSGEDYRARFIAWSGAHPDHHCVAAFDGDTAVGMAWLAVVPRVPGVPDFDRAGGDVQSVFLREEYRGKGVGTLMMERIERLSGELGLVRVTVQSGTRALSLYKRRGFEIDPKLLVRQV